MNIDELLQVAEPIIRQSCAAVTQRFRGFVEMDDLCQEARLWCFEHSEKVAEWLDSDDPKDVKHGCKKLSLTISRLSERHARKERAVILGYRPEDEWFANRGLVTELLPAVIAGGYDGYEVAPKELLRAPSNPAEGNNRLALLADVTAAWEVHPSPLLERLYGPGATSTRQQIADEYEITTATLKKRENQALDMIIRYLGGENPYA